MKNKMIPANRHTFFGKVILATMMTALALSACKFHFADDERGGDAEPGVLIVRIAQAGTGAASASRTAVADIAASAASYEIVCKNAANVEIARKSITGQTSTEITGLVPGTIKVSVTAKNASGAAFASGENDNVILTAETSATANISLYGIQTSGVTTGEILLTLQWPTANADSFKWHFDSEADAYAGAISYPVSGFAQATIAKTGLESGAHALHITFVKGALDSIHFLEQVNVYDALRSDKWLDSSGHLLSMKQYTPADFASSSNKNLDLRIFSGPASYRVSFDSAGQTETILMPSSTSYITMIPAAGTPGQTIAYTPGPVSVQSGSLYTVTGLTSPTNAIAFSVTAPDGTSNSYTLNVTKATEISTPAQLAAMSSNLSGAYVLTSDINMDGAAWTPVGSDPANSGTPFTGSFDGGGHTISNLTAATSNGDAGMFGYISSPASISNVRLKNVNVSSSGIDSAYDGVGGLVGENDGGTISHCSVSGSVSGCRRIGGLVGNNRIYSTITECYSTATVTAAWDFAGGLVGSNWGEISNCYSRSAVSTVSGGYCGELCGSQYIPGTITNCFAAGTATGPAPTAGLMGVIVAGTTVSSSYYDTSISGLTDNDRGTPKTTADLKIQSTYSNWDFDSTWTINPGKNGGYPYLRALPVADQIVIPAGTTASALQSLLSNNLDGDFILTGPVDLSGYTWKPIGTAAVPFTGTFDGGNNTITGMTTSDSTIYAPANPITGMFGWLGSRGIIKNVHLTGITVGGTTNDQKGGLVGYNVGGTILRCSTSGKVTGDVRVGGLVGRNDGTVSECWSNAAVSGTYSGGLVGENYGTIENSYARGSVTAHWGGGLVGSHTAPGIIRNCYAATAMIESGTILGNTGEGYFQGLIGNSTGTVQNSYFDSSKIATIYYQGHVAIASEYFGTLRTPNDLKDSANFLTNYSGWASSVWTFTSGKNGGYPCLRYNEGTTDISVSSQAGLDAIRSNLNGDYVLSGDVTLLGYWTPIGSSGSPFSGSFDGGGHTISGLKVTNTGENTGLIGVNKGIIQNLGIAGAVITGGSAYTGVLVGNNYGKLYRCWSSGTVTGKERIGGLTGQNTNGWIEECYSVASVTTTDQTSTASVFNVGGLAGSNDGTIKNCYARGAVNGYGLEGVGGLYGYHEPYTTETINSYSTGHVTATNAKSGGFCYQAGSQPITFCFYDRDTSGRSDAPATPTYTADMFKLSTFETNWDIVATVNASHVWGIDTTKAINNGYPYLQYFGTKTVAP